MMLRSLTLSLWLAWYATASAGSQQQIDTEASNQPPRVSIIWPRLDHDWETFSSIDTLLRIKTDASDEDGYVTQVRFYAGTNLIGVATNAPFNLLWEIGANLETPYAEYWVLTALAVDDHGATSSSGPINIYYSPTRPLLPLVEILSPREGEVFAARASFTFTAEVLASGGDAGPVEFFVGTNSVGVAPGETVISANTYPVSVLVTNLQEGTYQLAVGYLGYAGGMCLCEKGHTIRVTKLGVCTPRVANDGRVDVEVVTSFPGRPTVIEESWDFRQWMPVSTNEPAGNCFIFTEPFARTNSQRAYRAHLLP